MINQVISHYRIIDRLGAGGMGEVYLAEDASLGRRVAIKILPPQHTQDAERLRRFRQEAKAASALNHPNILTVHEIGEADGQLFIVTEFIDGESLRAVLTRGRMETGEALRVATQVASALAAAHEAGIVHRDIKPENIMIRRDGYVKVLDFGLAKLTERPAQGSPNVQTPSMSDVVQTESGLVLGTADYMSPEQATAGKVDGRSDIFAVGAVLYEMLAGERAFQGGSAMETVAAVIIREPKPLPASAPPELANIVTRCLRKDPARRFQTVADLKVALEDVKEAATHQRRARSLRGWHVAAVAALLLMIAGLFMWREFRASTNAQPLAAVPFAALPGIVRYPSFSPDGDRVAFSWNGAKAENPDIFVQQAGSGSPLRPTSDPGNDFNPVWAPDGRSIAFLRSQSEAGRSEVRLIAPLGGADRRVADVHVRGGLRVTPPYLAWCPESKCLVVTDSPGEGKPDALFVVSLETGEKRQLSHPQPPVSGDTHPAVSPDGKWLVFRRMTGLFVGELYRLPLAAGITATAEPQRITGPELDAQHPTWMADNRTVLFSARGRLWKLRVSGSGMPTPLPFVGEYGIMPAVSTPSAGRASRLVYVRSFDDGNIWRVQTRAPGAEASSPPKVAIASTRIESMPQLAPDGRRLAFTSDRTGNWEIWVAEPNGANAVAVTSMGAVAAGYPHWSPDGKRLVFHSNLAGQWDLYAIPAAGGTPQRLTSHPATDDFPSFSRDGTWVYFSSDRTGEGYQSVWKVPALGGDAIRVTKIAGYCPQESPDGAWLYYVDTIDRPSALWRLSASGGAPEKVLQGVYLGNFAVLAGGIYYIDRPTGERGIHYVDLPLGNTRLRYYDFATRKFTTVARDLGGVDIPLTASSDGRTVFYPRLDASINDLMLVERFRD